MARKWPKFPDICLTVGEKTESLHQETDPTGDRTWTTALLPGHSVGHTTY